MRKAFLLLGLLTAPLPLATASCSGDDDGGGGPINGGSDGGGAVDAGGGHDAAPSGDTGGGGDTGPGGGDAGDAGGDGASGTVTLTINNYLNWCTVSVNGGTTTTMDPISVPVAPNTVVNLHADTAGSSFVWGYWLGVDGDGGHDTNMNATATVTKNMTIQACCPTTAAPTTPCPPP